MESFARTRKKSGRFLPFFAFGAVRFLHRLLQFCPCQEALFSSAQHVVLATGSLVRRRYSKGGGHLLLRHFIRMFKSTQSSAEDSAVYLPEVFLLIEFSGQSNHRV